MKRLVLACICASLFACGESSPTAKAPASAAPASAAEAAAASTVSTAPATMAVAAPETLDEEALAATLRAEANQTITPQNAGEIADALEAELERELAE